MSIHCLRSPLNIVHAGLDIVRSEIEASSGGPVVFISPETAKMIRNMFSASETAIQILNDLLHYEHIDAGEDTNVYYETTPQYNAFLIP
jgi:signal transduction histidine kinase